MDTDQALDVIGCSRRQLDYLTRCGAAPADMNVGSGYRREWDPATVVRLFIAYRAATAAPTTQSPWPLAARAALDPALPPPPRQGYVILTNDPVAVTWVGTWPDVRRAIEDQGAGIVATYDLADLHLGADLTCALAR